MSRPRDPTDALREVADLTRSDCLGCGLPGVHPEVALCWPCLWGEVTRMREEVRRLGAEVERLRSG